MGRLSRPEETCGSRGTVPGALNLDLVARGDCQLSGRFRAPPPHCRRTRPKPKTKAVCRAAMASKVLLDYSATVAECGVTCGRLEHVKSAAVDALRHLVRCATFAFLDPCAIGSSVQCAPAFLAPVPSGPQFTVPLRSPPPLVVVADGAQSVHRRRVRPRDGGARGGAQNGTPSARGAARRAARHDIRATGCGPSAGRVTGGPVRGAHPEYRRLPKRRRAVAAVDGPYSIHRRKPKATGGRERSARGVRGAVKPRTAAAAGAAPRPAAAAPALTAAAAVQDADADGRAQILAVVGEILAAAAAFGSGCAGLGLGGRVDADAGWRVGARQDGRVPERPRCNARRPRRPGHPARPHHERDDKAAPPRGAWALDERREGAADQHLVTVESAVGGVLVFYRDY